MLKLVDQLDRPATTAGSTQVIRLKHADSKNVAEIVKGFTVTGFMAALIGSLMYSVITIITSWLISGVKKN